MPLNSDKPDRWTENIDLSVRQFNEWFLANAPQTFVDARKRAAESVKNAFEATADFTALTPQVLQENPAVVQVLRMATLPPLARDRLIGLAYVKKPLVHCLEEGRLPRSRGATLTADLEKICGVLEPLLDHELFPWRTERRQATAMERELAAFVVGDRLCSALSNPIIRNAHQVRQTAILTALLSHAGYVSKTPSPELPINFMEPGTYSFGMNVPSNAAIVAVDLVIQPQHPTDTRVPIMVELKAAGDFTNPNKRRKEESEKFRNLKAKHGEDLKLVLFLCGYFDKQYLRYEAEAGIDWVWEHRPDELLQILD